MSINLVEDLHQRLTSKVQMLKGKKGNRQTKDSTKALTLQPTMFGAKSFEFSNPVFVNKEFNTEYEDAEWPRLDHNYSSY